jgi:hypothetical protein
VNTPHPELEELAALVEADATSDTSGTGAAAQPELAEHVASCPQCSSDLAALRDVRATLRSLPPVTMPDDVAQRLESALRDAAAAPVAEPVAEPVAAVSVLPAGGSGRRGGGRGSRSGLPNFSAAAAVTVFVVIALGVGLGIGLRHSGESKGNSGTTTAAGADSPGSIVLASGTDYTQDAIRNQVAGLLLAKVPDAHAQFKGLSTFAAESDAGANAAPTPASSAAGRGSAQKEPPTATSAASATSTVKPTASSAPALAPRTAFSGPLDDPARLQACVQALLNQPGSALLVDYAYYAGKPATIIVLQDPAQPSTLDIYVESGTADCANDLTLVTYLHNVS